MEGDLDERWQEQILNLSLDDWTTLYKSIKWRRPPLEDDLKRLKVEYLSNPLLDNNQNEKIKLRWQDHFF